MVSRPVSGVLFSASRRLGDHPSVRPTSGLPREGRTGRPYPTFGLAPGGVYRAARVTPGAGALLPHRFTLACAPVARGHRRSVLCGTVLRVAPTGCQPAPCPAEPRLSSTRSPFPKDRRRTAVTRPTHHRRQCATGRRADSHPIECTIVAPTWARTERCGGTPSPSARLGCRPDVGNEAVQREQREGAPSLGLDRSGRQSR